MTEAEKEQYIDYANSFNPPIELVFFGPKQLDEIKREGEKYESSSLFVKNILDTEDFEERINKATIEGKIFSPSQMAFAAERIKALDNGDGVRIDVTESLISKSGQSLIMSNRLQAILGFESDGYMLKDEQDELVSALQADGVPSPEIDRVLAAMNKFGAIVLQRGIFISLKSLLEESIGHTLTMYNPSKSAPISSGSQVPAPTIQPKQGDELPAGFIEYLKNNDKEFDRVEHEITKDPNFVEFFTALQNRYSYYKTLPADRMAHEVILRPQLWAKLSPQTKAWVQTIVERNREGFQSKVSEVAAAAGSSKLEELKKTLGK